MMKKLAIFLLLVLLPLTPTARAAGGAEEAKVSTQRTFQVGSFVDATDGLTPETAVTITAMDEKVLCPPNGGTCLPLDNTANSWTAVTNGDGDYFITIAGASLTAYGKHTLVFNDDDVFLPTRCYIDVVSANFWDNKYGTTIENVNSTQFSGDGTAADNLELQYDGTGIIGDSFPFTQAAGAAIGGGLAINTTMVSVTVVLGSEQDLANASTSSDTRWTGDDDGAGAEFIFRCTPSDTSYIPVEIMFEGYYDEPGAPNVNSASLQVYNFNTVGWDTVTTISNAAADEEHEVPLSHAHRAPGGGTLETVVYTIGDVMVKFKQDTQETGNACLLIDFMVVGFVGSLITAADVVDEWETQSQADPTGFHVNVKETNGTAQTANDNGADINTLITGVDVTTIEDVDATDALDTAANTVTVTSIGANVITDAACAADFDTLVNDEVSDVLKTDTISELGVAAPAATPTFETGLMLLYMEERNKTETTAAEHRITNDAGTVITESNISDNGVTFTKEEFGAVD